MSGLCFENSGVYPEILQTSALMRHFNSHRNEFGPLSQRRILHLKEEPTVGVDLSNQSVLILLETQINQLFRHIPLLTPPPFYFLDCEIPLVAVH